MADLICRWRNGTPKTVAELVNILPHKKMPVEDFRKFMKTYYGGEFFRTPYQLACQLALYCELDDGFYYPRFDHDIDEKEALEYLKFWIARYYIPNPYVGKEGFKEIDCPTYFLKSLCDYAKNHPNCKYEDAYRESFGEIAKNNDDIIRNYINNFSEVLNISKNGILTFTRQNLEERFAFMERNDKSAFFFHFNFNQQKKNSVDKLKNKPPTQIIYYGVPGCGKSNKIREELKSVSEFQKIRCVFHPEYTNADFIGQVKPCSDNGKIEYNFTPGPFAKILRRAYLNPGLPFYLEIEEINRGNAAAIFGEVFQLCDRIKPEDEKDEQGFGIGWSVYGIENADLSDYIRDIAALDADNAKSHSTAVTQKRSYSEIKDSDGNPISSDATSYISLEISRSDFDNGILHVSENSGIRLPPNLNIYATMNTSDQNVFTLDNAFQRRFDMELVRNEFADDEKSKAQQNAIIEGTDSTWGDFWQKINGEIVKLNRGLASTEDKRLGPWFVSSVAGDSTDSPRKISAKTFAEKVLKYLWDDAFKFKRPQAFAEGLTSLEQVVKKFEDTSIPPSERLKAVFSKNMNF